MLPCCPTGHYTTVAPATGRPRNYYSLVKPPPGLRDAGVCREGGRGACAAPEREPPLQGGICGVCEPPGSGASAGESVRLEVVVCVCGCGGGGVAVRRRVMQAD